MTGYHSHLFAGGHWGFGGGAVLAIVLALLVFSFWMLIHALRYGAYVWAAFIFFCGLGALPYYFIVYRASDDVLRGFFNILFQLLSAALVIFLFTAIWIVFDGQTDLGEKADVALVVGPLTVSPRTTEPVLDRVVALYKDEQFPYVIVTGAARDDFSAEPAAMVKYLEDHGLPANAVIEGHSAENPAEAAREVAGIMKARRFQSVMVITDYYRVTRVKMALHHEGVPEIQKAHVGRLRKEDLTTISREVVAIYDYIGKTYVFPAAEKLKHEAEVGMGKAKAEADAAKKKIDKGLDNLPK